MASRAPVVAGELDYFPTPPWAARAGGELIAAIDPGGPWTCWEPAFGGGHMAHGLADYFSDVRVSDIEDHGGTGVTLLDFLSEEAEALEPVDWIVTNPPFVLGEAFVRASWRRARRGVAMLLRLSFIEGIGRHRLHFEDCPLSVLAPFCERVPMVKGRWDPEASSATAYAWFVYRKGDPESCRVIPIPPGSKIRLSRQSDRDRFVGTDQESMFGAAA